ncbi:protein of unknown function [Pseudomonas mediterranea]
MRKSSRQSKKRVDFQPRTGGGDARPALEPDHYLATSPSDSALLSLINCHFRLADPDFPMPIAPASLSRRFSVAPMMDWTDPHCRYFLRILSKNALLYTEMVTTGALLNGDHERFLRHHETEHPLALQLGGSVPGIWPPARRWPRSMAMTRSISMSAAQAIGCKTT